MTLRFFYHYPETAGCEGDMLDPGPLSEVAAAAENAGFTGLSPTEHPVPGAQWLESGGHQSLDPLVALGHAAAATRRLRLLTNLVVAPYRNPFLLAKAATTVDRLSGGRLILGLGAGYQKSEFHALGVEFEERNALFDEALSALSLHWSGSVFSYRGRHFDARGVTARPRPASGSIPVWIGGNSKLSRRRVAERAQGWLPMMGPPQLAVTARTAAITSLTQLAGMIREISDAAEAAGRTGGIDVVCPYRDWSVESPALEADRHREAFAGYEKAGVTGLVVTSATRAAPATLEFIQAFGQAYLR